MTSVPATAAPISVEPHAEVPAAPVRRPAVPKLLVAVRAYRWAALGADVGAGVTVAVVALPLAMAFAIASGVPPEHGLACAIVAGTVVSVLGGSQLQIAGPAGAFVVLVSGIVAAHGVAGLFLGTLMSGVLLIVLSLTGLGDALRFLPRPVVVGFTNGVAILLASTQWRDVVGTGLATPWPSAALAAATLALLIGCAVYRTRVPGSIVALVAGTLVVAASGLPVATIATRFPTFPAAWPAFGVPLVRVDLILGLLPHAFAMAVLGAIASLRSATLVDRLSGDRHNSNVELMAQGLANVASSLFGGLPATGAIARTEANVRAGARTPVAGLVHALTLLAIVGWAAPYAALVPMPVLAAIVVMVAWAIGGWREIPDLFRAGPLESGVWALTLSLTIGAGLPQAIPVGLALGALLFIKRAAATTDRTEVIDEATARARAELRQEPEIPPFAAVFRVAGPLLYASVDALDEVRARLDGLPPIVILRVRDVTAIDASGLTAIEDLARAVQATGRVCLVAGARDQTLAVMRRARFDRRLGAEHLCATFDDALSRAREIHANRFSGAWPNVAAPISLPVDTLPESGDDVVAHIR
jgi:sulfate permease, SulP family